METTDPKDSVQNEQFAQEINPGENTHDSSPADEVAAPPDNKTAEVTFEELVIPHHEECRP